MSAHFTTEQALLPGRRILALWLPWLASERILRARLGRSWRSRGLHEERPPLVISGRENNSSRIVALDDAAAALSLRRGMGVADARAMHPAIEVVEAEPEADRRLLEGIADWCDRYTPLVALCGDDGLFLDITGCAHLFGGEKAMLDDILDRLWQQGFRARAGLASTPGAAWAAARFLSPAVVAAGAEQDVLAPLPLSALRLEPAVRTGLESVGLRNVGAIMSAPRAPLARRFGKTLLMRLDQALGRLDEAVSPRLPVPPLSVERHLVEPITMTDHVEHVILMLGQSLKGGLEQRGEGARFLQLALFRVDGAVLRIAVGASRPLRDPALIQRLLREKLAAQGEALDAGYGIELMRLSVLATAPFTQEQADLSGDSRDEVGDVALFADRVRARLGEAALTRPAMAASHIPEHAAPLVPLSCEQPVSSDQRDAVPERPIRLFARPEPVEVTVAEVPEGPPLRFRWRRALHRVARAEGPERIAPEWWRGQSEAPTRDYFRVEDEAGRRYWLYRQGLYGASTTMPRWFLHGIFA